MNDDIGRMDYETAMADLERTIEQLGGEQEDLAASVQRYELGLALARRCAELLQQAERRLAEATAGPPASSR